jgi:hypothetical protein
MAQITQQHASDAQSGCGAVPVREDLSEFRAQKKDQG